MSGLEPLEKLMPQIAEAVWGQPRPGATTTEIRYGDGKTVNPLKGRWWIHGPDVGGGPIKLLQHELGLEGRDVFDWLRQHGFPVDDAPFEGGQSTSERAPDEKKKVKKDLVATFDYVDEGGSVLFQACRFEWTEDGKRHKNFSQRRRARDGEDTRDGWVYTVKGLSFVPYRLPELQNDISNRAVIFFVEGEKVADRLRALGVPATTNPMGAGKWWDELTPHFKDADVVILRDNDEPGLKHRDLVGSKIIDVARRVRALDLPELPPKGDAVDWLDAGGTIDALYDLVDTKATDWRPDRTVKPKLTSILWKDLDAPGPEHEWLIEDVLTVGEVSMIAGPSRHGKSFAAVDEGLAVSRGSLWLGSATLRGGVLYIAAESGRGVKKRLRAYRAWHEIDPKEELPFVLLPNQFDLYGSDDNTKDLLEDCRLWDTYFKTTFSIPLRLIVIDTFAAATPGADENSSKDIGIALKRATLIANQTGANVQLVHHMNAGGTKPRGWTGILANIDSVITIEKHDKRVDEDGRPIRFATMTKNKDGEDGRSWRFVLRQIEISKDKKGKAITSCVCVPPKEDIDADREADAGFKATDSDRQLLTCLVDAIRDKGEHPPNDLRCPARIKRVVRINDVKQVFKDRFQGGETGSEEQIRQRLAARWKRAHDRMVQYRVIDSADPWMWFTGKPVLGMRIGDGEPRRELPPEPSQDALDQIEADIQL